MLKRVILVKEEILSIFIFPLFFFDVLHNNVGNVLHMDICLLFLYILLDFYKSCLFFMGF